MKKKILIISIIAIAILIGVSFNSVVGNQSFKSISSINSPLFVIRNNKAIDVENEDFICNYFGKYKKINISIPKLDNRLKWVQKFSDIFQEMENYEFKRFVNFLFNYQGKRISKKDIPEIINLLYQLKINSNEIINCINYEYENKLFTEDGCETVGFNWIPECWKELFMLIILNFIWLFYTLVTVILDCK